MKIVLCSVLALLQVLICTLGQGAFTLCVRNDGTQRVEWSWATSCTNEDSDESCHCGCSDKNHTCSDELPPRNSSIPGMERTCDSCTDYTLMAVQPTVTADKYQSQTIDELSFLIPPMSFQFTWTEGLLPQHHILEQQSHLLDSLTTIISSAVIRC